MDERRRRANIQQYDLGVGFFGFFAVAFVATSLFFQVTGRDPIWASVSALAAFAILGVIWVFRRRYLQRTEHAED